LANLKNLPGVGAAFLQLGLISFGGPTAHLGYFRTEFVEKRGWLSDPEYADVVALCQFLPGPGSSQVAFVLGLGRAGLAGAILGSLCFMLPSAAAMILLGYGIGAAAGLGRAGWLHGLMLSAVAVVALAVWNMGVRLCPDWPRRFLALAGAAAVIALPGARTQIAVIAGGGLVAWWLGRGARPPRRPVAFALTRAHAWAAACLVAFAVLLVALPIAARATRDRPVEEFDAFYRAGALVFGGGHVVLPLLRAEVVRPGWVGDQAFLAGYGAAQAVPGPLFTFAAYLGTVLDPGPHRWLGGILALAAIFLPAWLIVGGTYPFWEQLRARPSARSALDGANAAVVGVLLAALWHPVCTESVRTLSDGAAALGGLVLLARFRLPPWALVGIMAAAGQWILR
jgi:chromate transporter